MDPGAATRDGLCLVILPTYNERENIGKLVTRILGVSPSAHVLVIDDSSPDGTADVVNALKADDARIHLVVRPGKMGLGSAYLLGFEIALANDFSGVITMDADFSHDPSSIEQMLNVREQGHDLVIGSRYVAGGSIVNWSVTRRINSAIANILARRIVGPDIRDCTSGFRLYSSELLERMRRIGLKSAGYSMLVELLYEAVLCRASIAEVPIRFQNRTAGLSKISMLEIAESLLTLVRLKIRHTFQTKDRPVEIAQRLQ